MEITFLGGIAAQAGLYLRGDWEWGAHRLRSGETLHQLGFAPDSTALSILRLPKIHDAEYAGYLNEDGSFSNLNKCGKDFSFFEDLSARQLKKLIRLYWTLRDTSSSPYNQKLIDLTTKIDNQKPLTLRTFHTHPRGPLADILAFKATNLKPQWIPSSSVMANLTRREDELEDFSLNPATPSRDDLRVVQTFETKYGVANMTHHIFGITTDGRVQESITLIDPNGEPAEGFDVAFRTLYRVVS